MAASSFPVQPLTGGSLRRSPFELAALNRSAIGRLRRLGINQFVIIVHRPPKPGAFFIHFQFRKNRIDRVPTCNQGPRWLRWDSMIASTSARRSSWTPRSNCTTARNRDNVSFWIFHKAARALASSLWSYLTGSHCYSRRMEASVGNVC